MSVVLTKKDFEKEKKQLYTIWKLKIAIRNRLVANFPDNVEALKYVVLRQKRDNKLSDEEVKQLQSELEEDASTSIEGETFGKCVFLRDEKGLYIRPRQIKGLMKETAMRCLNIRGARDYINHAVHIFPEKIYLMRNGKVITKPDKEEAFPICVMTKAGRRSSVKVVEVVEKPCELEFEVWIPKELTRKLFTDEVMKKLWIYAGDVGLLGERALGDGKFDIVELRKLQNS